MPDRVGQQLGNYQLLRLLGEGGFAEVYLGEHIHLGTQAAVKVLHTQLARSDIEQFRHEARTIAHLKHHHIVRVFDFGVEGTTPFLVIDYAQGGTLRTLHPKGTRLPTDLVVSYVQQIASALQYAHDHKVIHRDIKPENLLVDSSNDILLSDFGIALIAQSSRYQDTIDMVGTIAYMAPEQIAGHPRTASDQYALGIVVYEWLCGTRPFHGSFIEIAAQQSVTPPPSLLQYLPTLSPEIERVIMTALAKGPEDRFASVRAFANALLQASQHTLPMEEDARSAPFSSEPLLDTPVPPPTTATLLAKAPYQPANSSGHSSVSVPVTETPPDVPGPEKMNEQPKTLHRNRGTRPRLAWFSLVGLVIVALVGGLIWFTFSQSASFGTIVHATPTGSVIHHTTPTGNVTEFPLPTFASGPDGIIAGSDGNLWFTEYNGNKIGRISISGAITEFPIPTSASQPYGITAGPDDNLWFTEINGHKIGRISISGAITEFPLPTSASAATEITAGPDGNLWFTEYDGKIGRISISGAITEFPIPTSASQPYGITVGPDDNLWFTEWNGNKIGRINISGAITEFPLPTSASTPAEITTGPDGNLWFTEYDGNKVGRISISGAITEFPVLTSASKPEGITAGPDGNLWFTEWNGNKIGHISSSGAITEFPVPTSDRSPLAITTGPDGNLWFTEYNGNKIGRITSGK